MDCECHTERNFNLAKLPTVRHSGYSAFCPMPTPWAEHSALVGFQDWIWAEGGLIWKQKIGIWLDLNCLWLGLERHEICVPTACFYQSLGFCTWDLMWYLPITDLWWHCLQCSGNLVSGKLKLWIMHLHSSQLCDIVCVAVCLKYNEMLNTEL